MAKFETCTPVVSAKKTPIPNNIFLNMLYLKSLKGSRQRSLQNRVCLTLLQSD